jgi:glutamyl-Q tRNA(Asp) synthetase
LHARQSGGEWLVRIEDIDPPREVPGSADSILRTLEALELEWDRSVRFQSARIEVFRAAAVALHAQQAAYYCQCSRQQLRADAEDSRYPGTCSDKDLPPGDAALRLRVDAAEVAFTDGLRGPVRRRIAQADGDFVILRRDRLPAYHLAVVIDDADQGVTDVVRGVDLLNSTPLHIQLQRRLALDTPRYWHIPLVTNAAGEKLSKSSGAVAIDILDPPVVARRVLSLLGMSLPRELWGAPPVELWRWAQASWRIDRLAMHPGPISLPE